MPSKTSICVVTAAAAAAQTIFTLVDKAMAILWLNGIIDNIFQHMFCKLILALLSLWSSATCVSVPSFPTQQSMSYNKVILEKAKELQFKRCTNKGVFM